MIVTDEQRRWWFATHPEYSWSHQGGTEGRQREEEGDNDTVSPEDVDSYVDNAMDYVHGPVADLLRSVKRNFGTEGNLQIIDRRLAFLDEAGTRSDRQTSAAAPDKEVDEPSFWDAVLKGIDDTLQDWERWFGLGGGLTNHRRKLANNMIADKGPRPDDHAAHHIVAPGDNRFPEAIEARRVLEKFGIDLDQSANGVWLPNRPDIGPGAYHPSLHNGEYYRRVERLLRYATTKEEAIDILNKIGQELSKGTFPR